MNLRWKQQREAFGQWIREHRINKLYSLVDACLAMPHTKITPERWNDIEHVKYGPGISGKDLSLAEIRSCCLAVDADVAQGLAFFHMTQHDDNTVTCEETQ